MAILLIGTSGPFGRYIDLPAALTIAIRALLALVFLFAYLKWKGISLGLRKKGDAVPLLLTGMLMGVHWVTYFYALQLSNVAIGMLSLFTYPVWTALLEPLFFKTRFQRMHLLLALLVLLGIYLLVPKNGLGTGHFEAILYGTASALAYAIRNLILKTRVSRYQGSLLMWYQLLIISVLLSPVFMLYDMAPVPGQWKGLMGVALITTAIGHTMFINTFKKFSITTISIISSVQPVYGILLGAIWLSEIPSITTLMGGALILASAVIESIRSDRS